MPNFMTGFLLLLFVEVLIAVAYPIIKHNVKYYKHIVEYTFDEEWSDGMSGWYGWEDGIYTYPEYGVAGNMQFRFYNYETGELLGAGSVRITN